MTTRSDGGRSRRMEPLCVYTLFSMLSNTVPQGGGLNFSDARNGASGRGKSDLLRVRAEFPNGYIIFD